ncbi:MAG: hypothetical protein HDS46_05675 [Bacteroides sp.]|nr:hypothetical protein [Bacteroides sp.]
MKLLAKTTLTILVSLFATTATSASGQANEWREVFESTVKMSKYYGEFYPELTPHKPFSELSDEEAKILLDSDTIILIYQREYFSGTQCISITGKTYTKDIYINDVYDEEALKHDKYDVIGTKPTGFPIYKSDEEYWNPYLRPGKNPYATLIDKLEHWDIPIPLELLIKLEAEDRSIYIEAFRVIRHDNSEFSIDHYFIPIEEYNKASQAINQNK